MAADLISRIAEKAKSNTNTPAPSVEQNEDTNTSPPSTDEHNIDKIVILPIASIIPHPKNREYFRDIDKVLKDKLMEDMRENGLINPVIVNDNLDGTYTLLSGHQRIIAAKRLGWQQIKARVDNKSELEAEKLLIRDNLFRRHMGGMELARALEAFAKLTGNHTNKTIRQIADELGENRNTVHFYMKLNKLIPEFQQLIDSNKLSPTAAQAFTSMDEDEQRRLFNTLGESILGKKKSELEEEIKRLYGDELELIKKDKENAESEKNLLISQIQDRNKDVDFYKDQVEAYKQQVNILSEKALVGEIEEETKTVLSKLAVADSIFASVCLSSIDMYDEKTLLLFAEKLKVLSSSISNLSGSISAAIENLKYNDVPE